MRRRRDDADARGDTVSCGTVTSDDLLRGLAILSAGGAVFLYRRQRRQFNQDQGVAAAFDRLIARQSAPCIYDARELPHPKTEIFAALLRLLVRPLSKEMTSSLEATLQALARYQPGVGDRPIDPTQSLDDPDGTREEAIVQHDHEIQAVTALLGRAHQVGMKRALRERWKANKQREPERPAT
jgi:hypothetical protein